MAKCWLCSTKKGKRYCPPLDKIICPTCCGTSRLKTIDCNADCRYRTGVAFQNRRTEQKELMELMKQVPQGQYDDIFQEPAVAFMAYEIETFIREIYVSGNIRVTDTTVFEAYKTVYAIHFQGKPVEENRIDELTKELLNLYSKNIHIWELNMDEGKIGQVFLRLMISVKNMSGGRMGEYGYLNFLKHNLRGRRKNEGFVIEDKFGVRITKKL